MKSREAMVLIFNSTVSHEISGTNFTRVSVNLPIIATRKIDPIIANAELLKCGGRRRRWSMLNRKSKAGATFCPLNQVHSYNV